MDTVSQAAQDWLVRFELFLPRLVVSLVVFVISLVAAGEISRLVRRAMKRRQADPELMLLSAPNPPVVLNQAGVP